MIFHVSNPLFFVCFFCTDQLHTGTFFYPAACYSFRRSHLRRFSAFDCPAGFFIKLAERLLHLTPGGKRLRIKTMLQNYTSTRKLNKFVNWARRNSMEFITVTDGCYYFKQIFKKFSLPGSVCTAAQLTALNPARADVLVVAGSFSHQNATRLKQFFQQISWPRQVIAAGSCAVSGGMFESYSTQQGIDEILPVDIYIPGCPPSVSAIAKGFNMLREKIRSTPLTPSPASNRPGQPPENEH